MKLIKILRDKIQIKTDQFEFSDIRINDLIVVSDGDATLVTMVTSLSDTDTFFGISEEDYISQPECIKVIECSIIGSIADGSFHKAIAQYPTTNVEATKIEGGFIENILNHSVNESFVIGSYQEHGCPAWVNGNKLFQRHSCIVGNTGSGKSETVAKILEETAKLPSANLVVFDVHGEYAEFSYVDNIKIDGKFPFPIWMFGFSDMVSNILMVKEESATVAMSALKKCYQMVCPNGNENKPCYFDFEKFLDAMCSLNKQVVETGEYYKTGEKAGMPKTVKGELNGRLGGIINTLEAKRHDKRYSFLFEKVDAGYLNRIANRILCGDKAVKNIDLSDIPHDIAISIIGAITKLVYEIQKESDEIHPVTIVCDEAHVYIPNNFQLSASERRMVEIFENIAKEGRKFGVTLMVASQRPSELNKTIMAQCANFIVMKLNNENDKSMMKGMLPDGSDGVIDSTTMFAPGDALMIGDAVEMPLKVHIQLAKERPQSSTIDFWDEWGKDRVFDVGAALEKYMEQ